MSRPPVAESWQAYKAYWYIASDFGEFRNTYYHNGADINLKTGGNTDLGKPLVACLPGKIVYYHNGSHPNKNYGRHMVQAVEFNGTKYWPHYAHCQKITSQVKDVSEGEQIGELGKSGTTYAHLHFSVFKVDPKTLRNGIDTIAKTKQELLDWWIDPVEFLAMIEKGETMPNCDDIRLARDRNWDGAMKLLNELNITDVTDDNFTAKVDEGVAEIKRLKSSRDGYKGEVTKSQNKVLELQEAIRELKNKKPEVSTLQRLTSRKWISSFSGIIVLLVSKYVGIDLDPADVALVVTPIIMFVSAEGFTDHVRMLSNQELKQG